MEELVPLEISQLFFFDAEKIRTLTEDETSSQALGAAIKSLLGLDIVERLIADAAVIQARQAKEGATAGHREKVEALEQQAQELSDRISRLIDEAATLREPRPAGGSRPADGRDEVHCLRAAGTGSCAGPGRAEEGAGDPAGETEAQLLKLAAGELPLALVPELSSAWRIRTCRSGRRPRRRSSRTCWPSAMSSPRDCSARPGPAPA